MPLPKISFYTLRKHQKTSACLKSLRIKRPVAWNEHGRWCPFHIFVLVLMYNFCRCYFCRCCSFLSKSLVLEKWNELYQAKKKMFSLIRHFWSNIHPKNLQEGVNFINFLLFSWRLKEISKLSCFGSLCFEETWIYLRDATLMAN